MQHPSSLIIGIDVGGTKIHGAVYTSTQGSAPSDQSIFQMLTEQRVLTDLSRGFDSVIEQIVEMITTLKSQVRNISAIGIGLPGLVDQEQGTFFSGGNVKTAKPFPIKTFLNDRFGLPVAIDNDARCFVAAEHTLGQARGYRNVIGLTLGTGLGSGVIVNGEMLRGSRGCAPEIGATLFQVQNEKLVPCVQRGTKVQSLSHAPRGDEKTGNTFLETIQLSSFEDLVASKASDETRGEYLAILISNLLRTFNSEAIAFGGGIVTKRWAELEPQIWEGVKRLSPEMYWKDLNIYASKLEHPATLGAALLSLKLRIEN